MTAVYTQARERASDLEERLGLSPEVAGDFDERGTVGHPNFGYYRMVNGWITVDQASEMEELHYRREKWEPLPEYGFFDMTTEYTANHPFELLFMKGGSVEMPQEQVVENGWHINPPMVPGCLRAIDQNHKKHTENCIKRSRKVLFPQLEGSDAKAWPCDYCTRISPTKAAHIQHMGVMHKDELGQISSGNATAEAIIRGLSGAGAIGTAALPAPATVSERAAQNALAALTNVGLNKAQRTALEKLGIELPEEDNDGEGE